MNKESVMALLAQINDENSGRDLVSAGAVREVGIHDDNIAVDIRLGYHLADQGANLAAAIKTRLESEPGIENASVNISSKVVPHKVQEDLKPLASIANLIAVGSGLLYFNATTAVAGDDVSSVDSPVANPVILGFFGYKYA